MALAIAALLVSTGPGALVPHGDRPLARYRDPAQELGPLNRLAMLLGGIFLSQASFSFVQSALLTIIGERIVYDLRTALYNHLHRLSLDFYAGRRVGEIVSRLSSDVTQMRAVLTGNVASLLSQSVTLIGLCIVVSHQRPAHAVHPGAGPRFDRDRRSYSAGSIQKISTGGPGRAGRLHCRGRGGLAGNSHRQELRPGEYEMDRYASAMPKDLSGHLPDGRGCNSLFGSVMIFLGLGSIARDLWYGGREVIAGRMTLAMITGFLIYGVIDCRQPRWTVRAVRTVPRRNRRGAAGLRDFGLRPSVEDAPGAQVLPEVAGRSRVRDVAFHYEATCR